MKPLRVAIVCSLAVFSACGADKRPADAGGGSHSAGAEAMAAGAGSMGTETFGDSSCRECLGTACGAVEMACHGEPACAAYLACIDSCPLTDSGALDTACAEACALPESGEVEVLALHVSDCRRTGNGAGCACPQQLELPPLLRQVCEPATDEDACRLCQKERCCETRSACLDSGECDAYRACREACQGQPGCSVDCADAHPEGDQLLAEHGICMGFLCGAPSECGAPEGDPCLDCWHTRCGDELYACNISPECSHAIACAVACREGACRESCATPDPEGVARQDAFLDCATTRCISECSGTGDDPP
jgi:hypothetical protein